MDPSPTSVIFSENISVHNKIDRVHAGCIAGADKLYESTAVSGTLTYRYFVRVNEFCPITTIV